MDLPRTTSGFIDFTLISCAECNRLNYAQIFSTEHPVCEKCGQRLCKRHLGDVHRTKDGGVCGP